MTKTLAIELGPFNVNVNCVAPGFIATAMTQQTAERMGVPFEQFRRPSRRRPRCGGSASPRTSPARSPTSARTTRRYVSGQVIYVAGGPRNWRGPGTVTVSDTGRVRADAAAWPLRPELSRLGIIRHGSGVGVWHQTWGCGQSSRASASYAT